MINLLKQHIENIYQDYRQNGIDISSLKPYLKNNTIETIPPESIKIVLSIPEMLQELVDVMMNPKASPKLKAFASGIYSYIFNPLDYIPDNLGSIYGFLDDGLILFYGLNFIEKNYPDLEFKTIHQETIIKGVKISENILPDSILSNLKEFSNQVNNSIRVESQII